MPRTNTPVPNVVRALLMAVGVTVIGLGVAWVFVWHSRIVDFEGSYRWAAVLAMRAGEAAALYGGSWLVVRGWNGGPRARA
ncbi:hypothetical protein [Streptomyces hesseae]|uniref:Uncharacterized protein n=1 Tax=Streptomyces hesseae TaxID=3075519 RepID=A0ABU2SR83_9ACTN|nr:hypothetical protein [Streptomyces sp. DSM 40473]MDT0450404.1 hypothetical protein [Streptomyces sp. DSM 40473]